MITRNASTVNRKQPKLGMLKGLSQVAVLSQTIYTSTEVVIWFIFINNDCRADVEKYVCVWNEWVFMIPVSRCKQQGFVCNPDWIISSHMRHFHCHNGIEVYETYFNLDYFLSKYEIFLVNLWDHQRWYMTSISVCLGIQAHGPLCGCVPCIEECCSCDMYWKPQLYWSFKEL